jgi:VanZ family protein
VSGRPAGAPGRAAAALRWGPALVWAAAIFTLSSFSQLPSPPGTDKSHHFVAYAILGAAIGWGLTDRAPRRTTWPIALAVVLLASAYGATDEWHQGFVPGREMSALDWLADTAGAAIAGVALRAWAIIRARR